MLQCKKTFGYDFPKYNHVSGWLAGWVDGRRKTLHSSIASEIYTDSASVHQAQIYLYLLRYKSLEVYT